MVVFTDFNKNLALQSDLKLRQNFTPHLQVSARKLKMKENFTFAPLSHISGFQGGNTPTVKLDTVLGKCYLLYYCRKTIKRDNHTK